MKKRILPLLSLGLPVLAFTGCAEDIGATLADAGQNTIVGMGVVFAILILISLVISAFNLIGKAQNAAAKKKEEKLKKNTPAVEQNKDEETADAEEEEIAPEDDLELVAVIAAAIAASENADPSGIVVRSIRKVSSANHWKRG